MAKLGMVMNTENTAVSQWGDLDFNSVCVFNGKLVGADGTGLSEYGGSASVDAYFETASVDFGLPDQKRVVAVGINGYYTGSISIGLVLNEVVADTITSIPAGTEENGTLIFNANTLSFGRFVGIEFSNVNGSDFIVNNIDALVEALVIAPVSQRVSGRQKALLNSFTNTGSN